MVALKNGKTVPYSHSLHSNMRDRILGVVSDSAMIVGEAESLFKFKRDSKTGQILRDTDGNPIVRADYSVDKKRQVTVGICGRLLLHKKYVRYVPDHWLIYDEMEQTEQTDFVVVQIR